MPEEKIEKKVIKIPSTVTVKRFSELLGLPVSQVITELMKNKIMATINEEIDFETASIIAQDLEFETEKDIEDSGEEMLDLEKVIEICKQEKESGKNLKPRPPVVTILGHVDHGKTSLLDAIRKTSVVSGEAGGITQHIKAYQVKKKGQLITFIDTPGHEAFSAMRERGVNIAGIAVLVVAADDGVRPQTKEVIEYLKEKKIPTVVAINKVDKPEANVQKVKQELADDGILLEEWGGEVLSAEVSAKQNKGIDGLLESILLVAEIEDFKADYKRDALAIVLESHLDPQKGAVATVLVKTGTLKTGQDIVIGSTFGRIRKMEDSFGKEIKNAYPSTPVTIIGINDTPKTNDVVQVVSEKTVARTKSREALTEAITKKSDLSKQKIYQAIDEEKVKKLNLILKADVQGSLEAIQQILSTIKSDEVAVNYVETGVGNITESDIKIAETSGSYVIGFSVVATSVASRMAEGSGVTIKTFDVIYELVEEIKNLLAGLLPPEIVRTDLGRLNVLAIFKRGKKEMIVGGRVTQGKVVKGVNIEVKRGGEIIGKGKLVNLQQNKENTGEVKQGNECGITFEGDVKIEEKDTLIIYREEEKRRKI
ncbi:translation initiation factor IF-2 [bacterium BMS3Abin15]|nr:translation initiation factor IF-2 [bacterium BMS3Abin15]HDZ85119.1 translation initiation factor IF-2 [Candidatus Moranbacteria bacterium]